MTGAFSRYFPIAIVSALFFATATRCHAERRTFAGDELASIQEQADRVRRPSKGEMPPPTYEMPRPFGTSLAPPTECAGAAMSSLVYVAEDARLDSLAVFVDRDGRVICSVRAHTFDVRSNR